LNGIIVTAAANIQAWVHVDHSVLSSNGGAGFLEFASASNGGAFSMLTGNAIGHNGGSGVSANADSPGGAWISLADNAIYDNKGGLVLQSNGTLGFVTGNKVILNHPHLDLECDVDATVFTTGNNSSGDTIPSDHCTTRYAGW